MFIKQNGSLYMGDMQEGDRAATAEEIAQWEESHKPTPLQKIRELEAQHADAQAKLTRQSLLTIALDRACADPLAAGLERHEVHAILLSRDNGYAALWSLEQEVERLRAQL